MQVSLRKAAALESSLRDIAKGVSLSKTVAVSVYSDNSSVEKQVEEASAALRAGAEDIRSALNTAYAIRGQIAEQNAKVGINRLLNERAALDATDRALAGLTAKDRLEGIAAEHAFSALTAQKARNEKSEYGTTDNVSVNVVGELAAEIKATVVANQKRKTAIADELLALNVGTTIVLSDEVVAVLTKHNLV